MTLQEKSEKIEEYMNKNFLFISPKYIKGGAQLVNDYLSLELYENMEKNTEQFASNEIINLIVNAKNNGNASKRFDFYLIFCGDFNDLPNDLGNPIDFILNNKDRIVAVYKYVINTVTKHFFVGMDQTETINEYNYVYLKFDTLLKLFEEYNVEWKIDTSVDSYIPSAYKDNSITSFIINYDYNKELEANSNIKKRKRKN